MSRENILAVVVTLLLAIILGGAAYLPAWMARTHSWSDRSVDDHEAPRHPNM